VAEVLTAAPARTGATRNFPVGALPGLVCAFRLKPDGTAEELAVDHPIAEEPGHSLWLHFNLADARAGYFLRASSFFPTAARELLVAADDHQQLNAIEGCLFGVFPDLVCGIDGITDEIGFLHFAVSETLLVTGRHRPLGAITATRNALKSGRKVPTLAALMDTILEYVVDSIDRYAEEVAGKLDHIEERILAEDMSDGRNMLGRIRRTTVRLHRQLVILRSLMQRFELDLSDTLALKLTTSKLRQRLDWLDLEVVSLRDRAHLLQEEVTIKTAEETNRNLQILAIVTTIFLPATLVTGIFGMNVMGLPFTQNPHGFLWSMLILIGSSALVLWLLKRSGIFGR
jgi:zinc transporter